MRYSNVGPGPQAKKPSPRNPYPQADHHYRETCRETSVENTPAVGHNSGYSAGNWIAISRDIRNHPIVGFGQPVKPANPKRGSYSRAEAWLDLVMEANWLRRRETNKGKVIWIERGQLMGARSWLAMRWNWTESTVRVFLDALERDLMIDRNRSQSDGRNKGHFANVITICNYDVYQTLRELETLTEGRSDSQSVASQQPVDRQTLNNITKDSDSKKEDAQAKKPAAEDDRVEVNGEAIYLFFGGKKKRIPYSTIDLWAVNARMPDADRARRMVQGILEGWVADGKMPDKPSDTIQRALRYTHIDDEVGKQRLTNEQQRRGKPNEGVRKDDEYVASRARALGISVEEYRKTILAAQAART